MKERERLYSSIVTCHVQLRRIILVMGLYLISEKYIFNHVHLVYGNDADLIGKFNISSLKENLFDIFWAE